MLIAIYVEVEDGGEYADPEHEMGITEEAYSRLMGEDGRLPLGWLGDVKDVVKVVEVG